MVLVRVSMYLYSTVPSHGDLLRQKKELTKHQIKSFEYYLRDGARFAFRENGLVGESCIFTWTGDFAMDFLLTSRSPESLGTTLVAITLLVSNDISFVVDNNTRNHGRRSFHDLLLCPG